MGCWVGIGSVSFSRLLLLLVEKMFTILISENRQRTSQVGSFFQYFP